MNAMFEVHKGPLPQTIERMPRGASKFPVETMQVDEYLFLPGRPTKYVSAYISRITRNLVGKWICRHRWMRPKPEGGWVMSHRNDPEAVEGTAVSRIA